MATSQLGPLKESVRVSNHIGSSYHEVPWVYPRLAYPQILDQQFIDCLLERAAHLTHLKPRVNIVWSSGESTRRYTHRVFSVTFHEKMGQYHSAQDILDAVPMSVSWQSKYNKFQQMREWARDVHLTIVIQVVNPLLIREFREQQLDRCLTNRGLQLWSVYQLRQWLMSWEEPRNRLRHLCVNVIIREPALRRTAEKKFLSRIIRNQFHLFYNSCNLHVQRQLRGINVWDALHSISNPRLPPERQYLNNTKIWYNNPENVSEAHLYLYFQDLHSLHAKLLSGDALGHIEISLDSWRDQDILIPHKANVRGTISRNAHME